jgi:hypothetical protein
MKLLQEITQYKDSINVALPVWNACMLKFLVCTERMLV